MRWQRRAYTVCGALLLAAVLYLSFYGGDPTAHLRIPIPWLQPRMGFVCRNATRFFVSPAVGDSTDHSPSSSPLYVNGWNSYWLLGAAASGSPGSRSRVPDIFRRGRAMGMGVCRTWAFSDGGGVGALQIFPGRLDEAVFQALDYVIYEARRNQIRLILSLVNNLDAFGGKAQYVKWAQEAGVNVSSSADPFFSDPTIKGYYKNYVKIILTRKNSYSGIKYCNEPAIFAWELMNEPRCVSNSSATLLQDWIVEMAAYVKSLDEKHLVTVGLEGFYASNTGDRLKINPGEWASSLGSDFLRNSAVENIDFASVHAYPDSWIPKATFEEKSKFLADWVDAHVNDSEKILKKPVLFTEVGSYLHVKKGELYDRDILLKTVYDKIYESAQNGHAGAGALIWQLLVEGMQGSGDEFALVARQHPTTYSLITQQSCRLQYMFREETNRKVGWPCEGLKF